MKKQKSVKGSIKFLPNELLLEIVMFMETKEILNAFSVVSKKFRELTENQTLWKDLTKRKLQHFFKNNKSKKEQEKEIAEKYEELKDYKKVFLQYPREFWFPFTTETVVPIISKNAGENTIKNTLTQSKFGGQYILKKEEKPPVCKKCGKRMFLFLQVNSSDFPEDLKSKFFGSILKEEKEEDVLFQFLFCSGSDFCIESNEDHEVFLARILKKKEIENGIIQTTKSVIKETIITNWKIKQDFPSYIQIKKIAKRKQYCIDHVTEELVEIEKDKFENSIMEIEENKIFGYPIWCQGEDEDVEDEAECGENAKFLFQFSGEEISGTDALWGFDGRIYCFVCPIHQKKYKLVYDSY